LRRQSADCAEFIIGPAQAGPGADPPYLAGHPIVTSAMVEARAGDCHPAPMAIIPIAFGAEVEK